MNNNLIRPMRRAGLLFTSLLLLSACGGSDQNFEGEGKKPDWFADQQESTGPGASGSGLSLCEPAANVLCVEVENFKNAQGFSPLDVGRLSAASGGRFAEYRDNQNEDSVQEQFDLSAGGYILLSYTLSEDADVTVELAGNYAGATDDSIFWSTDGVNSNTANGLGSGVEPWEPEVIATLTALSAGEHKFYLQRREGGAQLDRLVLTASAGTIKQNGAVAASYSSIEFESYADDASFSPFAVASDEKASEGEYIEWVNGDTSEELIDFDLSQNGYIMADFTLSEEANVAVEVVGNFPNSESNSIFYQLQGVDAEGVEAWFSPTAGWSYATVTSFESLAAGNYTLYLQRAKTGAKLDSLLLSASAGEIEIAGGTSVVAPTPIPTPTPVPANATFEVEFESLQAQGSFSPFVVKSDSAASGGQFIEWPNDDSTSDSIGFDLGLNGYVLVQFSLTEQANVTVDLAGNFPNGSDDSIFWSLDGDTENTRNHLSGPQADPWAPQNITTLTDLAAGDHQIYIQRREAGAQLDKLIFTSSAGAISQIEDSGSGGSTATGGTITLD